MMQLTLLINTETTIHELFNICRMEKGNPNPTKLTVHSITEEPLGDNAIVVLTGSQKDLEYTRSVYIMAMGSTEKFELPNFPIIPLGPIQEAE